MISYNIVLLLLVLLVVASYPSWPYSSGWGYYPAGGLGSILVILILLRILNII